MAFSLGVFLGVSILIFFLFFELVTLPVIIIIVFEGRQPEKVGALYYIIIYTGPFSGAFLYIIIEGDLEGIPSNLAKIAFVGIFLAKRPVFLLHRWLPKAHVEAPTVASILLAGVLLKVGLFGLMKALVWVKLGPRGVFFVSLLGINLAPISALFSADSKQFLAYSRVRHMNLLINGLSFYSCYIGRGSYLVCLSHGYIRRVIFLVAGDIYHKNITRFLYYIRGVRSTSGLFTLYLCLICLGNAGVPPNLSF